MSTPQENLPISWTKPKLKDVATLSGRIGWKGLTAKEYTESGPLFLSVHSLNYGDYVDYRDAFHISQARYDESPEIMLQPGDILICKDGAGIGKVGIIRTLPSPSTINSSLLLIRSEANVEAKYLYYLLLSPYFQHIVQSKLEGATTPHLYQRDIKEFPIQLAPLPEQKHIVAILDDAFARIDAAIANTEKNIANARELFESYLNGVFELTGDGWEEKSIQYLTQVISGRSFKSGDFSKSNKIKAIKITNVGVRDFVDDTTNNLPENFRKQYAKFSVPKGSIVIALTRSIIADGLKVAIVPPDYDHALLNQRVAALIAKPNCIMTDFLFYYLCTTNVVEYVRSKANTLMQPNLSITDLRALLVPTPSIATQKEIVKGITQLVDKTKQLEKSYQQKLASLQELKQAILQKAFTGELTADINFDEQVA